MFNYDPQSLAQKWRIPLSDLWAECETRFFAQRPKRGWFSWRLPEPDLLLDAVTPRKDLKTLTYEGRVVLAHFARAFFPAYIPGKQTHYGSVVYSVNPSTADQLFELAWRVNELRQDGTLPPRGTEEVASAIRDDRSDASRIEIPLALGMGGGNYFANICILRSRLPTGYLHTRLVPILIAPESSRWCCLLPLRFWSDRMADIWRGGPPAYPHEALAEQCRRFNVRP